MCRKSKIRLPIPFRRQPKRYFCLFFTLHHFFIFLGIIIVAGPLGKGSKALFEGVKEKTQTANNQMASSIHLGLHMRKRRFEDIRSKISLRIHR